MAAERRHFLLTRKNSTYSVSIGIDCPVDTLEVENSRVSLVFHPDVCAPVREFKDEDTVLLLFPKEPFQFAAELIGDLPEDDSGGMFLTHGLASVLLQLPHDRATAIAKRFEDALVAYEIWPHCGEFAEAETTVWMCEQTEQPPFPVAIDSSGLPLHLHDLVQGIERSLNNAIRLSSAYTPKHTAVLLRLANTVAIIADKIRAYGDPYSPMSLYHMAELVEVSSGVAMMSSQAYGCCSPVLHGKSYFSNHSVFGVGLAWCAIQSIHQFSDRVFESFGANDVITKDFRGYTGFDICRDISAFTPELLLEWQSERYSLTQLCAKPHGPQVAETRHVVHFSGRWGYHEALHVITAAEQAIPASASFEWNLMTLTHEFMHSHVRRLIAGVIPTDREAFESFVNQFAALNGESTESMDRRTCVGFAFLQYLDLYSSAMERLSKDRCILPGRFIAPTTPSAAQYCLRAYDRILNEILVHVLDYYYFYASRPEVYLKSLWRSWVAVPGVRSDPLHYVQRSICAIAAGGEGSVDDRFSRACETLKRVLVDLSQTANDLYQIAIDMLESDPERKYLQFEFEANIYLADVARCFLVIPPIRHALMEDDLKTESNELWSYDLGVGTYEDRPIQSPFAFELYRMWGLPEPSSDCATEYETLWRMALPSFLGLSEAYWARSARNSHPPGQVLLQSLPGMCRLTRRRPGAIMFSALFGRYLW